MPKSVASFYSRSSHDDYYDQDLDEHVAEAIRNAHRNAFESRTEPHSPAETRFSTVHRASDTELNQRASQYTDERTSLLSSSELPRLDYRTSASATPRFKRQQSYQSSIRRDSRRGPRARSVVRATGIEREDNDSTPLETSQIIDDRGWYDQFTSTDWVQDSIEDAFRKRKLRSQRNFKGRLEAFFDGAQGWVLVAIIGCVTAGFAYVIDITEATVFDFKAGYCSKHWWYSKKRCCTGVESCDAWTRWSDLAGIREPNSDGVDFVAFTAWVVVLSMFSYFVTALTKTTISSSLAITTLDENLGADQHERSQKEADKGHMSLLRRFQEAAQRPPVIYYPAAGSGVAEVRVILSGFVLHGYLGLRTLVCKAIGLTLSVASGLSIGKEGPYVHIATCIGNIASRLSSKYRENDAKRRELLSASAAAGVAVAFGSPIGGVLFSLEEVSYYFPPKTLFRTFFCCIAGALSLKFLNPYGTNKIVLFEVRYFVDWKFFEIFAFMLLGVLGGVLGALFIKASRFWAKTFRRMNFVKKYPGLEVAIVALVTGLVTFWNRYTRLPVAELLYELAAPCDAFSSTGHGLCPTEGAIPEVIRYLLVAFVVKAALTTITFGIKVPAGIYVPSMVVGGLLGRIMGHAIQMLALKYPHLPIFAQCPVDGSPESCVVPGVYALVAAGATMCGVTRLSVTLAVILFELTGSLEHVLPFSLGVLIAKWTADAIEPFSIYDLLTDMNAYPYLDHKVRPLFDTTLGDITTPPNPNRYIEIFASTTIPATQLRSKLEYMHMSGELDGGLPILRNGVLVGLIAGPDLEFALDCLPDEDRTICLLSRDHVTASPDSVRPHFSNSNTAKPDEEAQQNATRASEDSPADFACHIDPAPVALDICSPMDLVFECFVKLGLRFICVLKEGKYAGLVHKKTFVRYVKRLEEERLRA